MPNTEVLVPFCRDLALRGVFGDSPDDRDIDRQTLARANSRLVSQGTRAIYSAYPEFVLLDINGEHVVTTEVLLEHLQALREERVAGEQSETGSDDEAE